MRQDVESALVESAPPLPRLNDRQPLGKRGLQVGPICLGTVPGPETVLAAFDAGINFFFVSADLHWPLYEGTRRGLGGPPRPRRRGPRFLDKPEKYLHPIAMATAKLFQHGGSQAVRLPKDFRFEGTEVEIEKRGDEVVLRPRPKPRLKTLADVARFMHENFPEGRDFPDREQPLSSQIRDLDLDQD